MPLRPNQTFNLIVASTALVLMAEGALLWKLGHDQEQNQARKATAALATVPTPLAAPLFQVPGLADAPSLGNAPAENGSAAPAGSQGAQPRLPSALPPALRAQPGAAAPPGEALPADKKALAKTYFDAGSAALAKKDSRTALENFLRVVEIAPNHLATRLNLAVLYLGARQPADALPHLIKATQIAPKNPATFFELARTLVALKRPNEAVAPLLKVVVLAPKEHASRDLLAQIYLAQKKPLEAYKQWTALAQAEPRDVDAHLQAAGLAADYLKRPAEAEKWLRLAANTAPKDPRAALLLGRFLLAQNKGKSAVQVLGKAAKANPTVFEIYPMLANARMATGDLSGARGALQSALLRMPVAKNAAQKQQAARIEGGLRFTLGRVLGQSKKPREAVAEFKRAAKLVPGDAEIQSLLALAAAESGDRKGAMAAVQAALAIDNKRPTDHRLLARLQAQSNNWSAANQQYEAYMRLQPRDGSALVEWAQFLGRAKKHDEELKIWARLAALDPKTPIPYLQSGALLRDLKRPQEALVNFQKALKLSGEDPNALFEIARLQTQLKRSSDATGTWKRLIAAAPSFTPAYAALLESSARSGDSSGTRLFLARQLAQGDNPKALKEVLGFYARTKQSAEARALLDDVVQRNPKARSAKAALDAFQAPTSQATAPAGKPTPVPPTATAAP
jgi:predicted Zn-dependent protease